MASCTLLSRSSLVLLWGLPCLWQHAACCSLGVGVRCAVPMRVVALVGMRRWAHGRWVRPSEGGGLRKKSR